MRKSSSSGPRKADEPWRHVPVCLCVPRAPGGHDKPVCLAQGERSLWLRQGWPLELGFRQQGCGQNDPWVKRGLWNVQGPWPQRVFSAQLHPVRLQTSSW